LRLAVEESTRSHTQTHALGVYRSVQQSRLVQAAGRLDAARRDLDEGTVRTKHLAVELTNNEDEASRSTKPELKARWTDLIVKLEQLVRK